MSISGNSYLTLETVTLYKAWITLAERSGTEYTLAIGLRTVLGVVIQRIGRLILVGIIGVGSTVSIRVETIVLPEWLLNNALSVVESTAAVEIHPAAYEAVTAVVLGAGSDHLGIKTLEGKLVGFTLLYLKSLVCMVVVQETGTVRNAIRTVVFEIILIRKLILIVAIRCSLDGETFNAAQADSIVVAFRIGIEEGLSVRAERIFRTRLTAGLDVMPFRLGNGFEVG